VWCDCVCFCPWGGDVHLGVVGEAVVVKFMTVEDSVDVFSVNSVFNDQVNYLR